jgi:serine phosphatase RsbU (regulator of sigma subunit)/Tfp pilus assembly protein PilF
LKTSVFIFLFLILGLFSFSQENQKKEKEYLDIVGSNAGDAQKMQAYLQLSHLTMNSTPLVSRNYAEKTKKLATKLNNKPVLCASLIALSVTYRFTGDTKKSIESINQALNIAQELNKSVLLADCYHELALISLWQNDTEKAMEYNLKTISIHKLNNNLQALAGEYNNLGISLAQVGRWDEAIKYFRDALKIDRERGDKSSLGNDYNNIGVFYIIKQDIDSAEFYIEKGLTIRESINDRLGICGSYNNLALLALEKNNIKEAKLFADKAFALCKQIESRAELIEILDTYYKIFTKQNDYKKALEYYLKKDSVIKKSDFDANAKKLAEMQSNMELEKKEKEILERDIRIEKAQTVAKKKNYLIILTLSGLGILIAVMFYILRTNRKIKEASSVINEQKKLIEEKHKDITDSINYAQKIQTALIISEQKLSSRVDNVFVMFKPRDIVSGDFYWYGEKNGYKLLAVADCTGHGVPGAFMSMIGITLLNQIVNEKGIVSPAEVLNRLREGIISSLNQTGEASGKRDGMDVALIAWNKLELIYAGANNDAVIVNKNEIIELKANKQPVGLYEKQEPFTEQRLTMENIAGIYLFTDGIVDQFGGGQGKKVKMKLFKDWLKDISPLDSMKQKVELEKRFADWKGNNEQTDDILVIGIKA